MIIESMIAMTLLTADNHRGDLNIEIDQEDKENVNKDIKEYDTTLFDKDSKSINDAIKQQQKNKDEKLKIICFKTKRVTRLAWMKQSTYCFPIKVQIMLWRVIRALYTRQTKEKHLSLHLVKYRGSFDVRICHIFH